MSRIVRTLDGREYEIVNGGGTRMRVVKVGKTYVRTPRLRCRTKIQCPGDRPKIRRVGRGGGE
ncbi:MAG: hypothetical protein AB7D57_06670 [Desulfovibrionaceae bacterium]